MNRPMDQEMLEDILDAYVASGVGPNSPLEEWTRRYPEFEREIVEFAASWSLMTWLPPAPNAEEVTEETLVLRGMSVVQNVLHRQSAEADSDSVALFESLIVEGQERGFEPRRLAHAVGLGDTLLRKLDRRLIAFTTIPEELIYRLARVMGREASSITAYLQQEPTLAARAEHRSEQAPKLTPQEDFFDAVRSDPTIGRDHADHWYALERSMGET